MAGTGGWLWQIVEAVQSESGASSREGGPCLSRRRVQEMLGTLGEPSH